MPNNQDTSDIDDGVLIRSKRQCLLGDFLADVTIHVFFPNDFLIKKLKSFLMNVDVVRLKRCEKTSIG